MKYRMQVKTFSAAAMITSFEQYMSHIAAELKKLPPLFVTSPVFRRPAWGSNHPLAIPRQTAMLDMCDVLGWLRHDNTLPCGQADRETLIRFHDPAYVDAFATADAAGSVDRETREKYHIGTMENPLFPGLFERAATTVDGAIQAAGAAAQGRIVFHSGGGTHHGRRNCASGFCYFNDPVFTILTLLDHGLDRIAYVDLDAHHGDGVELAFGTDERVFCCSIHETGRWPFSGEGGEKNTHSVHNLPVPAGINDAEYGRLMRKSVLPWLVERKPQAVVITCGADALDGDPLSKMALSNRALINATVQLCHLAPIAVVLGGGGYNPWTTARLWTALWGVLAGFRLPDPLPDAAQAILRSLDCDLVDEEDMLPEWTSTLLDPEQE